MGDPGLKDATSNRKTSSTICRPAKTNKVMTNTSRTEKEKIKCAKRCAITARKDGDKTNPSIGCERCRRRSMGRKAHPDYSKSPATRNCKLVGVKSSKNRNWRTADEVQDENSTLCQVSPDTKKDRSRKVLSESTAGDCRSTAPWHHKRHYDHEQRAVGRRPSRPASVSNGSSTALRNISQEYNVQTSPQRTDERTNSTRVSAAEDGRTAKPDCSRYTRSVTGGSKLSSVRRTRTESRVSRLERNNGADVCGTTDGCDIRFCGKEKSKSGRKHAAREKGNTLDRVGGRSTSGLTVRMESRSVKRTDGQTGKAGTPTSTQKNRDSPSSKKGGAKCLRKPQKSKLPIRSVDGSVKGPDPNTSSSGDKSPVSCFVASSLTKRLFPVSATKRENDPVLIRAVKYNELSSGKIAVSGRINNSHEQLERPAEVTEHGESDTFTGDASLAIPELWSRRHFHSSRLSPGNCGRCEGESSRASSGIRSTACDRGERYAPTADDTLRHSHSERDPARENSVDGEIVVPSIDGDTVINSDELCAGVKGRNVKSVIDERSAVNKRQVVKGAINENRATDKGENVKGVKIEKPEAVDNDVAISDCVVILTSKQRRRRDVNDVYKTSGFRDHVQKVDKRQSISHDGVDVVDKSKLIHCSEWDVKTELIHSKVGVDDVNNGKLITHRSDVVRRENVADKNVLADEQVKRVDSDESKRTLSRSDGADVVNTEISHCDSHVNIGTPNRDDVVTDAVETELVPHTEGDLIKQRLGHGNVGDVVTDAVETELVPRTECDLIKQRLRHGNVSDVVTDAIETELVPRTECDLIKQRLRHGNDGDVVTNGQPRRDNISVGDEAIGLLDHRRRASGSTGQLITGDYKKNSNCTLSDNQNVNDLMVEGSVDVCHISASSTGNRVAKVSDKSPHISSGLFSEPGYTNTTHNGIRLNDCGGQCNKNHISNDREEVCGVRMSKEQEGVMHAESRRQNKESGKKGKTRVMKEPPESGISVTVYPGSKSLGANSRIIAGNSATRNRQSVRVGIKNESECKFSDSKSVETAGSLPVRDKRYVLSILSERENKLEISNNDVGEHNTTPRRYAVAITRSEKDSAGDENSLELDRPSFGNVCEEESDLNYISINCDSPSDKERTNADHLYQNADHLDPNANHLHQNIDHFNQNADQLSQNSDQPYQNADRSILCHDTSHSRGHSSAIQPSERDSMDHCISKTGNTDSHEQKTKMVKPAKQVESKELSSPESSKSSTMSPPLGRRLEEIQSRLQRPTISSSIRSSPEMAKKYRDDVYTKTSPTGSHSPRVTSPLAERRARVTSPTSPRMTSPLARRKSRVTSPTSSIMTSPLMDRKGRVTSLTSPVTSPVAVRKSRTTPPASPHTKIKNNKTLSPLAKRKSQASSQPGLSDGITSSLLNKKGTRRTVSHSGLRNNDTSSSVDKEGIGKSLTASRKSSASCTSFKLLKSRVTSEGRRDSDTSRSSTSSTDIPTTAKPSKSFMSYSKLTKIPRNISVIKRREPVLNQPEKDAKTKTAPQDNKIAKNSKDLENLNNENNVFSDTTKSLSGPVDRKEIRKDVLEKNDSNQSTDIEKEQNIIPDKIKQNVEIKKQTKSTGISKTKKQESTTSRYLSTSDGRKSNNLSNKLKNNQPFKGTSALVSSASASATATPSCTTVTASSNIVASAHDTTSDVKESSHSSYRTRRPDSNKDEARSSQHKNKPESLPLMRTRSAGSNRSRSDSPRSSVCSMSDRESLRSCSSATSASVSGKRPERVKKTSVPPKISKIPSATLSGKTAKALNNAESNKYFKKVRSIGLQRQTGKVDLSLKRLADIESKVGVNAAYGGQGLSNVVEEKDNTTEEKLSEKTRVVKPTLKGKHSKENVNKKRKDISSENKGNGVKQSITAQFSASYIHDEITSMEDKSINISGDNIVAHMADNNSVIKNDSREKSTSTKAASGGVTALTERADIRVQKTATNIDTPTLTSDNKLTRDNGEQMENELKPRDNKAVPVKRENGNDLLFINNNGKPSEIETQCTSDKLKRVSKTTPKPVTTKHSASYTVRNRKSPAKSKIAKTEDSVLKHELDNSVSEAGFVKTETSVSESSIVNSEKTITKSVSDKCESSVKKLSIVKTESGVSKSYITQSEKSYSDFVTCESTEPKSSTVKSRQRVLTSRTVSRSATESSAMKTDKELSRYSRKSNSSRISMDDTTLTKSSKIRNIPGPGSDLPSSEVRSVSNVLNADLTKTTSLTKDNKNDKNTPRLKKPGFVHDETGSSSSRRNAKKSAKRTVYKVSDNKNSNIYAKSLKSNKTLRPSKKSISGNVNMSDVVDDVSCSDADDVTYSGTDDVSHTRLDDVQSGVDDISHSHVDEVTDTDIDDVMNSKADEVMFSESNNVTDRDVTDITGCNTDEITDGEVDEISNNELDEILYHDSYERVDGNLTHNAVTNVIVNEEPSVNSDVMADSDFITNDKTTVAFKAKQINQTSAHADLNFDEENEKITECSATDERCVISKTNSDYVDYVSSINARKSDDSAFASDGCLVGAEHRRHLVGAADSTIRALSACSEINETRYSASGYKTMMPSPGSEKNSRQACAQNVLCACDKTSDEGLCFDKNDSSSITNTPHICRGPALQEAFREPDGFQIARYSDRPLSPVHSGQRAAVEEDVHGARGSQGDERDGEMMRESTTSVEAGQKDEKMEKEKTYTRSGFTEVLKLRVNRGEIAADDTSGGDARRQNMSAEQDQRTEITADVSFAPHEGRREIPEPNTGGGKSCSFIKTTPHQLLANDVSRELISVSENICVGDRRETVNLVTEMNENVDTAVSGLEVDKYSTVITRVSMSSHTQTKVVFNDDSSAGNAIPSAARDNGQFGEVSLRAASTVKNISRERSDLNGMKLAHESPAELNQEPPLDKPPSISVLNLASSEDGSFNNSDIQQMKSDNNSELSRSTHETKILLFPKPISRQSEPNRDCSNTPERTVGYDLGKNYEEIVTITVIKPPVYPTKIVPTVAPKPVKKYEQARKIKYSVSKFESKKDTTVTKTTVTKGVVTKEVVTKERVHTYKPVHKSEFLKEPSVRKSFEARKQAKCPPPPPTGDVCTPSVQKETRERTNTMNTSDVESCSLGTCEVSQKSDKASDDDMHTTHSEMTTGKHETGLSLDTPAPTVSGELQNVNSKLKTVKSELKTSKCEFKAVNSELKTVKSELKTSKCEFKAASGELKTVKSEPVFSKMVKSESEVVNSQHKTVNSEIKITISKSKSANTVLETGDSSSVASELKAANNERNSNNSETFNNEHATELKTDESELKPENSEPQIFSIITVSNDGDWETENEAGAHSPPRVDTNPYLSDQDQNVIVENTEHVNMVPYLSDQDQKVVENIEHVSRVFYINDEDQIVIGENTEHVNDEDQNVIVEDTEHESRVPYLSDQDVIGENTEHVNDEHQNVIVEDTEQESWVPCLSDQDQKSIVANTEHINNEDQNVIGENIEHVSKAFYLSNEDQNVIGENAEHVNDEDQNVTVENNEHVSNQDQNVIGENAEHVNDEHLNVTVENIEHVNDEHQNVTVENIEHVNDEHQNVTVENIEHVNDEHQNVTVENIEHVNDEYPNVTVENIEHVNRVLLLSRGSEGHAEITDQCSSLHTSRVETVNTLSEIPVQTTEEPLTASRSNSEENEDEINVTLTLNRQENNSSENSFISDLQIAVNRPQNDGYEHKAELTVGSKTSENSCKESSFVGDRVQKIMAESINSDNTDENIETQNRLENNNEHIDEISVTQDRPQNYNEYINEINFAQNTLENDNDRTDEITVTQSRRQITNSENINEINVTQSRLQNNNSENEEELSIQEDDNENINDITVIENKAQYSNINDNAEQIPDTQNNNENMNEINVFRNGPQYNNTNERVDEITVTLPADDSIDNSRPLEATTKQTPSITDSPQQPPPIQQDPADGSQWSDKSPPVTDPIQTLSKPGLKRSVGTSSLLRWQTVKQKLLRKAEDSKRGENKSKVSTLINIKEAVEDYREKVGKLNFRAEQTKESERSIDNKRVAEIKTNLTKKLNVVEAAVEIASPTQQRRRKYQWKCADGGIWKKVYDDEDDDDDGSREELIHDDGKKEGGEMEIGDGQSCDQRRESKPEAVHLAVDRCLKQTMTAGHKESNDRDGHNGLDQAKSVEQRDASEDTKQYGEICLTSEFGDISETGVVTENEIFETVGPEERVVFKPDSWSKKEKNSTISSQHETENECGFNLTGDQVSSGEENQRETPQLEDVVNRTQESSTEKETFAVDSKNTVDASDDENKNKVSQEDDANRCATEREISVINNVEQFYLDGVTNNTESTVNRNRIRDSNKSNDDAPVRVDYEMFKNSLMTELEHVTNVADDRFDEISTESETSSDSAWAHSELVVHDESSADDIVIINDDATKKSKSTETTVCEKHVADNGNIYDNKKQTADDVIQSVCGNRQTENQLLGNDVVETANLDVATDDVTDSNTLYVDVGQSKDCEIVLKKDERNAVFGGAPKRAGVSFGGVPDGTNRITANKTSSVKSSNQKEDRVSLCVAPHSNNTAATALVLRPGANDDDDDDTKTTLEEPGAEQTRVNEVIGTEDEHIGTEERPDDKHPDSGAPTSAVSCRIAEVNSAVCGRDKREESVENLGHSVTFFIGDDQPEKELGGISSVDETTTCERGGDDAVVTTKHNLSIPHDKDGSAIKQDIFTSSVGNTECNETRTRTLEDTDTQKHTASAKGVQDTINSTFDDTVVYKKKKNAVISKNKDSVIQRSKDTVTKSSHAVSVTMIKDSVTKSKYTVTRSKDGVINSKDTVTKRQDTVIKNKDTVIKNKDTVTWNKESVVKNKDTVTKMKDTVTTFKDSVVPGLKVTAPCDDMEYVPEHSPVVDMSDDHGSRELDQSLTTADVTTWGQMEDGYYGRKAFWEKTSNELLTEISELEESYDSLNETLTNQHEDESCSPAKSETGVSTLPHRSSRRRKYSRRSLSLPTGALSYSDVKVTYVNGHFIAGPTSRDSVVSRSGGDKSVDGAGYDDGKCVDDKFEESKSNKSSLSAASEESICDVTLTSDRAMREEILSLIDRHLLDNDVFLDSSLDWSCTGLTDSVSSSSSQKVLVPASSTLPRRSGYDSDGQRPVSVNDVSLWKSSLEGCESFENGDVDSRLQRNDSFKAAHEDRNLLHGSHSSLSTSRLSICEDDGHSNKPRSKSPNFFKRMLSKRKSFSEKSQSKNSDVSVKEASAGARRMSLRSLFRRKGSSHNIKTSYDDEPDSPPIAAFLNDEDIGSIRSVPNSPYVSHIHRNATDTQLNYSRQNSADSQGRHDSVCSQVSHSHQNLTDSQASLGRQYSADSQSCYDHQNSAHACSNYGHPNSTDSRLSCARQSVTGSQLSLQGARQRKDSDDQSTANLSAVHSMPRSSSRPDVPRRRKSSSGSARHAMSADRNSADFSQCDRDFSSDDTLTSRSLSPLSATSLLNSELDTTLVASPSVSDVSVKVLVVRSNASSQDMEVHSGKVQGDISASNSNDSGIQHDVVLPSSIESLKVSPDASASLTTIVKLRKSPSPKQERPKSDITVRWADLVEEFKEPNVAYRRESGRLRRRPRPKSDLGGSSLLSETMKAFGGSSGNLRLSESLRSLRLSDSLHSIIESRHRCRDDGSGTQSKTSKSRRMSTPHPIKSRTQSSSNNKTSQGHEPTLLRSHSMPDNLDKLNRKKNLLSLMGSDSLSISSHRSGDDSSDESEYSVDFSSMHEKSQSVRSSQVALATLDERIEEETLYVEALWDHVTMDPDELGFRAGDVIRVTDLEDKDWWYGVVDHSQGWFPAAFVRMRVNQCDYDEDFIFNHEELESETKLHPQTTFIGKTQGRTNVINEIIQAERDYVKHLRDVVEGYLKQARKRPEMFPETKVTVIFGNLEEIYTFANRFLTHLEKHINKDSPHTSEIGQCFLIHSKGFEIYSDYCNNHPGAGDELKELYRVKKFKHFFEACRLLQDMMEIPLEGFLLTPVQKICKYHLQLAELLKYTPADHADHLPVRDAVDAMRNIALLVNERKRKMESIEKMAVWQATVVDWEGPDILEASSELIYSGDLTKVNSNGWSQERYFFLFDHQLVYCKKDLLKKKSFGYRGRIYLDHVEIIPIEDGKDSQYNVTVRNAWKIHDTRRDKWYLLVAKTTQIKQRWLKAFQDERLRVREDLENDFNIPAHVKQRAINHLKQKNNPKPKAKHKATRSTSLRHSKKKESTLSPQYCMPSPRTLLRQPHSLDNINQSKKLTWFFLGGNKPEK